MTSDWISIFAVATSDSTQSQLFRKDLLFTSEQEWIQSFRINLFDFDLLLRLPELDVSVVLSDAFVSRSSSNHFQFAFDVFPRRSSRKFSFASKFSIQCYVH